MIVVMFDVVGNARCVRGCRFVSNIIAGGQCDADGDASSLAPRELYTDTATSPVIPPGQTAAPVSCFS